MSKKERGKKKVKLAVKIIYSQADAREYSDK